MCDSPFYKKPKGYLKYIELPCGKCPKCKRSRVNSWVFRLEQEKKVSSSSYFITLTYDNDHIPISRNGFMTLVKKDFQNFMKRLRDYQKAKIKYYACGEYGSSTMRPHYHAIIFNVQNVEHISKAWTLGITHHGTVSDASVAYTCKYIDKPHRIPLHRNDDRLKEFSLMSKGLGKSYLDKKENVDYHKTGLRNYVVRKGGVRIGLPRYYKDRIYDDDEKMLIRDKVRREEEKKDTELKRECERKYGDKMDFVNYKYIQKIGRLNQYNNSLKRKRDETKSKSK